MADKAPKKRRSKYWKAQTELNELSGLFDTMKQTDSPMSIEDYSKKHSKIQKKWGF